MFKMCTSSWFVVKDNARLAGMLELTSQCDCFCVLSLYKIIYLTYNNNIVKIIIPSRRILTRSNKNSFCRFMHILFKPVVNNVEIPIQ